MDPVSGHVKAWVGGINYKYFKYDHVQQGKRQPGSTFKPIVYTTILGEIGNEFGPCSEAIDAPVTFLSGDTANPIWSPENSDGIYTNKTYTLRQALARSKNSITAYMMKVMGEQTPQKVLQYATRLGIDTKEFEAVPAMCLGTFDVSLYEMIAAYSTFMNKGVRQEPQFIQAIYDRNGRLLEEFEPEKNNAISEELAYVMSYMLRGATTESGGTALGLNKWGILDNNQIAAKTGTTQDYSDGWFIGMTPQLVSGCWVGADDRSVHFRDYEYGQGARMAMPIFGKFMQKVYADKSTGIVRQQFTEPTPEQKKNYKIIINCAELKGTRSDSAKMNSNVIDPNDVDNEFKF
jgi:penicillin-binding protein 1A